MAKELSKSDLFLQLAKPDKNGISRWVSTTEFTGEYERLKLGNGCDFARKSSTLAKHYDILFDKKRTKGSGIDAIKLNGYKKEETFNQNIRKDIKDAISKQRCVMLGICGTSENTTIEVDHKDGRKNDWRVSNPETQRIEDFQPLCKAANDVKRQICKNCKRTDKRWDARNLKGNLFPFYEGDENYTEELGCVGCYQYDPVEYRITCACKLSQNIVVEQLSSFFPWLTIEEIKKRLK